ncbi:MAG: hypothetical protein OEV44_11350 [Spirochaetota bacterium]|nr:hypothetical protein [Spirochaetota bacterium]
MKKYFMLFIVLIIVIACNKVQIDTPEGFVQYTKERNYYKGISSDGIVIKSHRVEQNSSEKSTDINLWSKEMAIVFKSKGYVNEKTEKIQTINGLKGSYTEYSLFHNGEVYLYAISLFTDDDDLYLVEVGGQKKYFDKRREAIMKAIKSLQVN